MIGSYPIRRPNKPGPVAVSAGSLGAIVPNLAPIRISFAARSHGECLHGGADAQDGDPLAAFDVVAQAAVAVLDDGDL